MCSVRRGLCQSCIPIWQKSITFFFDWVMAVKNKNYLEISEKWLSDHDQKSNFFEISKKKFAMARGALCLAAGAQEKSVLQ